MPLITLPVFCIINLSAIYSFSYMNMPSSVQFSCSIKSESLRHEPWTTALQASLSITNSWSSPKHMSIESVMPSSHLILCRPLLLLPPIPPSIRVFSNEPTVRMRWPKYWSFSFSISPSKEHPGSPVCCSPLSCKESDMTEQLNWLHWRVAGDFGFSLLHPLGLEQCLEQNGCC